MTWTGDFSAVVLAVGLTILAVAAFFKLRNAGKRGAIYVLFVPLLFPFAVRVYRFGASHDLPFTTVVSRTVVVPLEGRTEELAMALGRDVTLEVAGPRLAGDNDGCGFEKPYRIEFAAGTALHVRILPGCDKLQLDTRSGALKWALFGGSSCAGELMADAPAWTMTSCQGAKTTGVKPLQILPGTAWKRRPSSRIAQDLDLTPKELPYLALTPVNETVVKGSFGERTLQRDHLQYLAGRLDLHSMRLEPSSKADEPPALFAVFDAELGHIGAERQLPFLRRVVDGFKEIGDMFIVLLGAALSLFDLPKRLKEAREAENTGEAHQEDIDTLVYVISAALFIVEVERRLEEAQRPPPQSAAGVAGG
jgi:hypothetical protein